jgi:hypothetical protein
LRVGQAGHPDVTFPVVRPIVSDELLEALRMPVDFEPSTAVVGVSDEYTNGLAALSLVDAFGPIPIWSRNARSV